MNIKGQVGLYIHWPFCLSKCPYCDFNVHVQDTLEHDAWEAAYLRSLESYAELLQGRTISSVFFGGGTPSLMRPQTIGAILDKVHALWPCVNDLEVTLEANPTSVEYQKFEAFKEAGINRVSIGVQALNDKNLKFLGRTHSAENARKAIEIASENFDRFSFDLMYARPEQSLKAWEAELREAVKLARGHLSLYQLTIERNTPFHYSHAQGLFSLPNEDVASDFYNITQDVLEASGLPAYEVSSHAAEGHESRHNLTYWHYNDYIGIGPGAHGRLTLDGQKFATREHHAPQAWLERVDAQGRGAHPFEALSVEDRFLEALMMGLRLIEGVSLEHLSAQAEAPWQSYIDEAHLKTIQNESWAEIDENRLRLTREGLLRLNAIVPYLLKVQPEVKRAV
ncbi:MAG: radical SAM family heme chaperone HemW [Pseudomonadota bacterium]